MIWEYTASMNTARYWMGCFGNFNDAIVHGGYTSRSTTEEFNGASWSYINDPSLGRDSFADAGDANAGFIVAGEPSTASTEEYNGTSWSSGGSLPTSRYENAGLGTLNAGLSFGGWYGSYLTETNEYDGTSWSTGGALTQARSRKGGAGTQNAGLSAGGCSGTGCATIDNITEEYNGTSWSVGNNLNNGRKQPSMDGSQNDALITGGSAGTSTEIYNGTTWSTDINANTDHGAGCGSTSSFLAVGDGNQTAIKSAEHYFSGHNLTGTVSDTLNNYVQGAIVSVGNLSDDTDANGNYSITGISAGTYNITTTATNYFPDIYENVSIPPVSSYDPVLYHVPTPEKDSLTIMYPIEMNEESDIEVSVSKNFNNSIVTQISKKTEVKYNLVDFVINESAKEYYYGFIGYKIKTLNVVNQSIPNVYLIDCSFEKMTGNNSYWKGYLSFLKL